MRTYGKALNPDGSYQRRADGGYIWKEVVTVSGDDSYVWFTTLCQNLQLLWQESPMNPFTGIPIYQSLQQRIPPDYYVQLIQQQYQQYFQALSITRNMSQNTDGTLNIIYNVYCVFSNGTTISTSILAG